MNKNIKILFIGNSHTYMNDLPYLVKYAAEKDGYACDITMLAHGGWYLAQHVRDKEARFNIKYGNYDYIVLQEHAHPFDHINEFFKASMTLNSWADESESRIIFFEPWARKNDDAAQEQMHLAHTKITEGLNALLAPVGTKWWIYKNNNPDIELYDEDGAHASIAGSKFAARVLWDTIRSSIR